jgi:glutaredoxin
MHITLYKSMFCPRCHLAGKYLLEITSNDPEIHVEEVDVLAAPRRTWNDGIRMIPTLKIDDHILSALFMSRANIADFITRNKH